MKELSSFRELLLVMGSRQIVNIPHRYSFSDPIDSVKNGSTFDIDVSTNIQYTYYMYTFIPSLNEPSLLAGCTGWQNVACPDYCIPSTASSYCTCEHMFV